LGGTFAIVGRQYSSSSGDMKCSSSAIFRMF
jgi:hypothetical protein